MATVNKKFRVVGNPGRRFSSKKNPGEIIGFTLANTGKVQTMAKTKKAKSRAFAKRSATRKGNTGKRKSVMPYRVRRKSNSGMSDNVNLALFTIAGAVGTKFGTQAILQSKNTGILGYIANAGVGFVLWLGAKKFLQSRTAAAGIAIGTLVQIILRVINDFTPFGSYVANLGMGDYMAQSFVTPQVLVDPLNSATLANGYTAPTPMPALVAASPANAAAAGGNGGGMAGLGGSIYSVGRGSEGIYAV